MNGEDFKTFLAQFGKGIASLPTNPFKKEWEEVYNAVAPHYYGELPPILRKTFPNEDKAIFDYRVETYQAKTEACVTDAVDTLARHLSMAKHSIKYALPSMKEWVEGKKVENQPFVAWFLKQFVSNRIIDPNGLLVVNVGGEAWEQRRADMRLEVFFDFVPSNEIVFIDLDLGLLVYKAPSLSKWGTANANEFIVITDEFYGIASTGSNGELVLDEQYPHNLGEVPAVVLGGRAVSKRKNGHNFSYFKSDISSAVPYLNDAATSDNQYKSVVNANAFPIKIVRGVNCSSCHGHGWIAEVNEEHPDGIRKECGTCKGTGKIHISPLAGIYFKSSDGLDENQKPETPIEFVSPSVDVIQHLSEYRKSALDESKEVLNVDKAVKYAQSGIAKQIDKQPLYIKVKEVSDDVYMKLQTVLRFAQGLLFMSDADLTVIPPSSFDLKTEADLYQEFQEAMNGGAPDFVRKETFIQWIKSRFSTDLTGQQIGEIIVMYAPLTLSTVAEQKERYLMQTVTQIDLIKATFAFNELIKIYDKDPSIILLTYDEIAALLDAALAPRFDDANTQPVNLDPTDPTNDL
jgi:hypothetical protein